MRPGQSTLTPSVVHAVARDALGVAAPWAPFRSSVPVRRLLDLILLVAATTRTVSAIARSRFPFSHETARRAVRANLPEPDALANGLTDALHRVLAFSRRDRRRRWVVGIDTHDRPFYGDRRPPGVVGGPRKAGTKYFVRYASAVLLHRHRRYTVALIPVLGRVKPHDVVAAVLDRVAACGVRVRGVALDAGFDGGETIHLLQTRRLDYAIRLGRKGRTGRGGCFAWVPGTVGRVSWVTERTHRAVSTDVVVWRHRRHAEVRAYAFGGWGSGSAVAAAWRARTARRRYRERFGIETSYRQKNQALGWTTSTDLRYRLLLEGVAHLIRQVWVRLTEILARAAGMRPTGWVGALPLAEMIDWLADHLKARYTADRRIPCDTIPLT